MEIDILDSLEDFGYEGPFLEAEALKKAIDVGSESVEFTELTSWLSKKLKVLCDLEDYINPVIDCKEIDSFLLEVSSFLKELGCPHDCLTEGPLNERLTKRENRAILIDFLCSELHAACLTRCRDVSKQSTDKPDTISPTGCLKTLIDNFHIDVDNTESPLDLYIKINAKVEKVVSQSSEPVPAPLLTDELTESQWESLEEIQRDMHEEYKIRRQMLLTRLDVTVHSFKWGEESKGKEDQIAKIYQPKVALLNKSPDVQLCDVLSAREDLATLSKTSGSAVRKNTKSLVNTVIIGQVPDRGGRPGEQRPPTTEVWSKKKDHTGGMNTGQYNTRGGRKRRGGHQGKGKKFFKGGGKKRF